MPTFIDESGDTGKPGAGGTPFFRLAAVWVPSLEGVEAFRTSVALMRQRLNLFADFEFKYARTHNRPDLREEFLSGALESEFRFAFSGIDKRGSEWGRGDGRAMHRACAGELAALLRPLYLQAEMSREAPLKELIVVDNNNDHQYLSTIKGQFRALKSSLPSRTSMIGKVVFEDSARNPLLQLADMVCGIMGGFLDGQTSTWYSRIADRDVEPKRNL